MNKTELLNILSAEGISDQRVLRAMAKVPREQFVLLECADVAYENQALPIEAEQTISQPYVVARMTELLIQDITPGKVLEIGTGSGYQAAILSEIFEQVFTVERIKILYDKARLIFNQLNLKHIYCKFADGYQGWRDQAPFDAIIVTAAAETVPQILIDQLAENACLVMPVGPVGEVQYLKRICKKSGKINTEIYDAVSFVPMKKGVA